MIWNEKFDAVHIPSCEDIREYLGEGKSNWDDFTAYIEWLVETAIWNRLTAEEKGFLLSVSVLDTFTSRQAAIMLNGKISLEKIEQLLKTNDFIHYLPDKHLYNIHSILQDYLRNRFYYQQPQQYQNKIFYKAGKSCAANAQYFDAIHSFSK